MGRAVVREDHRNGGVVLLMWAGILAYLDRCGYDYVTGCVSVPVTGSDEQTPGSQIRGVRDFVPRRHAAPAEYTVRPYRPVIVDGRGLDDIDPPARVVIPPLMRGYLRLGAQVCGEPAHDPDFGVGDFPGAAGQTPGRHSLPAKAAVGRRRRPRWPTGWHRERRRTPGCRGRPATPAACAPGARAAGAAGGVALRIAVRATFAVLLLPALPLLAVPLPGRSHIQRGYCRLVLRCLGVRITVSGGPIRNLAGCWWSAVTCPGWTSSRSAPCMPGSFVAKCRNDQLARSRACWRA